MEQHSNLSLFLIISLALHLFLILLFRTALLKPDFSSEGSLAEVELLQMPAAAIIGDYSAKIQEFSGGRGKGGVSGKGRVSTEAPPVSPSVTRRSELTVPVGKPISKLKELPRPVAPQPPASPAPSPAETSAPAPPAPAPSAPLSSPPAVASVPVTPERGVAPPFPKPLPLLRDQKRELAKDESPLDFPRMKIPFVNQKDMDKMARAEPKVIVPEKHKGMSLDLDEFRFEAYHRRIQEKIYRLEPVWPYPAEAARKGLEGSGILTFTINKDGSIKDIKIVVSSGYGVIDEDAMKFFRALSPFPPLPDNMGVLELPDTAIFTYKNSMRGYYFRPNW